MQTTNSTTNMYEGIERSIHSGNATTQRLTRYQVLCTYTPVNSCIPDRGIYMIAAIEAADAAEIVWRTLPDAVRNRVTVTLTVRHPATNTLIREFSKRPTAKSS